MPQPTTQVTRLRELRQRSRAELDALLDATPLATIALLRDGHPAIFPTGFIRIGDNIIIHGSTGSPWMRELATGPDVAVSVTAMDAVVVARSGFEPSFHYRSAVLYGQFEVLHGEPKERLLDTLTDTFIPGRTAEIRASKRSELAATLALSLCVREDNWSLKVSNDWPEDPEEDVRAGAWAGVVPLQTVYGEPRRAPDCPADTPLPRSVRAMTGPLRNQAPVTP